MFHNYLSKCVMYILERILNINRSWKKMDYCKSLTIKCGRCVCEYIADGGSDQIAVVYGGSS